MDPLSDLDPQIGGGSIIGPYVNARGGVSTQQAVVLSLESKTRRPVLPLVTYETAPGTGTDVAKAKSTLNQVSRLMYPLPILEEVSKVE